MTKPTVPAALRADLNVLRCFAGTGIPTCVFSPEPRSEAFYSRHCRRRAVIASPSADPAQAVRDLVAAGRAFPERPVLFYGDDPTLLMISRHREALERYYRFLMPGSEQVEQLTAKTQFAALADRLGLPVPRTVSAQELGDNPALARSLPFPCVVKPSWREGWFRSAAVQEQGGKPWKALRADDPRQLAHLLDRVRQSTTDFVVQEYVVGGDDCIYSFHAYLDQHSRPLAHFVGRKIRTYPRDSGVSTYLELVRDEDVVRVGLDVLGKLQFVGPAKIDFKKDATTGCLYVLEINARYTLWNYLGTACGVNLPLVAYQDQLGQTTGPPQTEYRTGVRWLSFGADLRAFLRDYRRDGDVSWAAWLRSYWCPKVYDVFAWSDPVPFLVCVLRYAGAAGRRLAQAATGRAAALLRPRRGRPGPAEVFSRGTKQVEG